MRLEVDSEMGAEMGETYQEAYTRSIESPQAFWSEAARILAWNRFPEHTIEESLGVYGRWFTDGHCNTCFNAVDRHVLSGRADQAALIYVSPITRVQRTFSYGDLLAEVETLGALLSDAGVTAGDRVLIYMPMIPQAVFAMLACARIGAVHSVVFGGFAAAELAARIDHAKPRVVLAASCGLEPGRVVPYLPLLDEALGRAGHTPEACFIFQRSQAPCDLMDGKYRDWSAKLEATRQSGRKQPCADLSALDPLYILYTSGTTGRPKGVVRDNGGHMVALAWSMAHVFGVRPGDVFWAASDIGWVVGHSYIVYGPLLAGATTVLYEGKPVGTPDVTAFPKIVREHRVSVLFAAPTAFRAIRQEDPDGRFWQEHAGSTLRAVFLAGEHADKATLDWCQETLQVPAVDNWWQTETGWPIAATPLGLGGQAVADSAGVPMPGQRVKIVDSAGAPCPPGETGSLVLQLPLAPGAMPTLWQDDERFRNEYLTRFPGHYDTCDQGYMSADGHVFVVGRSDDVINVAGHRLSSGQLEDIVSSHPQVVECAVVGVHDELKGEVPWGFVVLRRAAPPQPEIEAALVALVRREFGPVAAFRNVVILDRLPKTRSGKILRRLIRDVMNGRDWSPPAALDDLGALRAIEDARRNRFVVATPSEADHRKP